VTGVLRLLATLRWTGWTLLATVIVAGCLAMAWWQLVRAQSPTGSLLNAGYALQWPLFGVFFAGLWWRMLRAEAWAIERLRAEADPPAEDTAPPAAIASSPFTPRPSGVLPGGRDAVRAGSAREEYNAMLAELAERSDGPADVPGRRS